MRCAPINSGGQPPSPTPVPHTHKSGASAPSTSSSREQISASKLSFLTCQFHARWDRRGVVRWLRPQGPFQVSWPDAYDWSSPTDSDDLWTEAELQSFLAAKQRGLDLLRQELPSPEFEIGV
jgi:hypothetical protein